MTTMPPPPPLDPQDQDAPAGDNFAQFDGPPPPWSASAVTGFIASLVICVPVVSSLVGLIAGIMGISATSGGRKRGRGLAIAAIPISLLSGVLSGLFIFAIVMFIRSSVEMKTTIEQVFKAHDLSDADLQELIDSKMSERAAQSTSPAKVRGWVEKVIADKGSLAEVKLEVQSEPAPSAPGAVSTVLVFPCRFVNGDADVRLDAVLSFKGGMKFLIDDMQVGKYSLSDEP